MQSLSHTDHEGKARMVDVSQKPDQERYAEAEGFIRLKPGTMDLIRENKIKKGDVIAVARIAGIQAAKKTAELIPLCHPLFLSHIEVWESLLEDGIKMTAGVRTVGKTGVEMEALFAVSTSLLTIYDMCKAVDKEMIMEKICLIKKQKIRSPEPL
jgi:cyclic pyranopterin phosphate synthase